MKNKYWAALLSGILVLCFASLWLLSTDTPSDMVQIKYGSNTMRISLSLDQELTFRAEDGGYNTVTVKDGKIAVTDADCPDGYCMDRGFCDSGTPIVCLPHRLVISFLGEQEIDGILG